MDSGITSESIAAFVKTESLPLIVEFSHESAQKIFSGAIKNHLLIFVGKSSADAEAINAAARDGAKQFKGKVLFVTVDTDEEDHQRILEFFGMKKEELPAMRLIHLEDDMTKYKPADAALSADNMKSFVQAFVDGNLKPHLLSDDVPEDWDKNPVKVLVASNFDAVVFDTTKDVLVEFCEYNGPYNRRITNMSRGGHMIFIDFFFALIQDAPWCGHCKQLVPIYDELAAKYQDNDSVLIAKMDSTTNELEHTKIQSFPTIKLYKKGDNKVTTRSRFQRGRFID